MKEMPTIECKWIGVGRRALSEEVVN